MVNHKPPTFKNDKDKQYSLRKILTIWAIVTIPMPILAFVIPPTFFPGNNLAIWLLLIGGMIWQFIVSVFILYGELDEFNWGTIKQRIWLQKPVNPETGKASYRLFWWLIPAFVTYALLELTFVGEMIGNSILIPFPFLASLPNLQLQALAVPEFVGAWWLLIVAFISCVFNYFLGEELLFRGILLPKMKGVFGKWDWAANSLLFALYHLHRPTQMLAFIFGGLAWTLPARYFKSIWFSIILHGLEGIFVVVAVFMVVSGLAFK